MKTIKVATVLLCFNICTYAQVSVKKGVVYDASTAIAKVDGKVGAMRSAKLEFFAMDGKSILSIKEVFLNNLKFPPFTDYSWFEVEFSDTKKKLKINSPGHCNNEKCIIELLANNGITINGNLIANQDEVISKSDYSPKLQADTVKFFTEEEKALTGKLKSISINRNRQASIIMEPGQYENEYMIVQDAKTIGWVTTEKTGNWTSEATNYKFYKSSPVNPNERVYAAFFKSTAVENRGFTYEDLKYWASYKISLGMDKNNHPVELAKFLVDNDYL